MCIFYLPPQKKKKEKQPKIKKTQQQQQTQKIPQTEKSPNPRNKWKNNFPHKQSVR